MTPEFTQLMAGYNQWMNQRLYQAASSLGADQLHQDQGAFFGSVFGTLQHIAVADTIWLLRFAAHPAGFASLTPPAKRPQAHGLESALVCALERVASLSAKPGRDDGGLVSGNTNCAHHATAALRQHGRDETVQSFGSLADPLFQPPNPPPGPGQHLAPPIRRGCGGDRPAGPHSGCR